MPGPIAPERLSQRKRIRSRNGKLSTHDHQRTPSSKTLRYSPHADKDQTLINQDDDDDNDEWTDEEAGSDNNDAYFRWEEEATLFSDLLEEAAPESRDADLAELAESLQKPFDEESRQLKKTIARTFVPVVNKIKKTISTLERTGDISCGAGILALNDACRELESSIGNQHELVQKHRTEYRARVAELLGKLEEEYAHRNQLWVDFEKAMNELANPVLEMLNEAPARMERTIASIEKQSRILEKEGASVASSATELTLKDLLSKLK